MENTVVASEKLEKILKSFLKPNFKPTNDVYIEMLISHLSKEYEQGNNGILRLPVIVQWIDKYLEIQRSEDAKNNAHITSFMLKLCALIIKNEWLLIAVKDHNLLDKIESYLKINKENLTPSVKLGHVQLISAIARHNLGLLWIKETKAWLSIVEYCQKNQTVYVVREAMAFIYDILYNFSTKTNEEELCIEILGEIVKPITDNVFNHETGTVYVDDLNLQRKLSPTLNLICYILQKTLESDVKTKIQYYFEEKFKLEINLWKLADMTQNQQFLGSILKTNTSLNYAKLVYEKYDKNTIPSDDFNQFGVNFFNLMKFCIVRRSSCNVLMLAELNHILWKKLGERVPEEILIENECIKFENQLIIFHLLPLLFVFKDQSLDKLELLNNYIMKLFSISCEHTLRVCYAFRDTMFECPDIVADLAYKSIHGILSMENILDSDRAVLVFQATIYALKEFVPEVYMYDEDRSKTNDNLLVQKPNLLSAILVGLYSLIDRYHITWKQSIESTCLLNIMFALLNNPNLTSMLAVKAIKLTQLSIEHYLSPNLALLVDNFNGSGMENLGPMITKRLHDNNWEVRDSTIELVTSISNISRSKFQSFQQHILDNVICPIIFSMAKNDCEPYVRASAVKCLNQMIMINAFWEKGLIENDIMEYLLTSICTETESIVRRELVSLLSNIFEHRNVSAVNLDTIYSTMAHSAVNDLDWEVKINALYFWKKVICRQFQNQGMIDGNFPTVTFSKENKKIVTLTEKEILLRIKKVLNELSVRGCLGVLLECLDDDCDLEVVKVTVLIIKKLQNFLDKYDYLKVIESLSIKNDSHIETHNLNNFNSVEPMEQNSMDDFSPSTANTDSSENVIEQIINAQDINLLASAYEYQMNMQTKTTNTKISENLYQKFALSNPNEFLNKIYTKNLDLLIESKRDWIMNTESFDSLLDDMLYSIKLNDVNDADCY